MQPPLKSKIWANGDLVKPQSVSFSARDSDLVKSPEIQNDGDRAHNKKNTERASKAEVFTHSQSIEDIPQHISSNSETHDSLAANQVPRRLASQLPSTSDEDWLRSRTSRLLGLADADEEMSPRKNCESSQYPERKLLDTCNMSNAETQDLVSTTANTSDPEKILETASARLFVRNLSYAASEEELKKYFETQGQTLVEEVSLSESLSNFVNHFRTSWCDDEYPDRDNLCFAFDVIRKSVLVDTSFF